LRYRGVGRRQKSRRIWWCKRGRIYTCGLEGFGVGLGQPRRVYKPSCRDGWCNMPSEFCCCLNTPKNIRGYGSMTTKVTERCKRRMTEVWDTKKDVEKRWAMVLFTKDFFFEVKKYSDWWNSFYFLGSKIAGYSNMSNNE
jgi:hypothetical protein